MILGIVMLMRRRKPSNKQTKNETLNKKSKKKKKKIKITRANQKRSEITTDTEVINDVIDQIIQDDNTDLEI